jgi:CheY-like chemotaxis protein
MILVVDDSEQMRFLVLKQLNSLGFIGEAVANGSEAVESASKLSYHLIFMDISMPILDGLEATKRIRILERQKQQRPTPIVALTGICDRTSCLHAGMDDFLTKPVLKRTIKEVLERWLPQGSCQDSCCRKSNQSGS